ncbi:hypothetical protein Btru_051513 [Bulinus truncatus]|nr:hypothetical protein Btru_051513 [Bulinus truncatus]
MGKSEYYRNATNVSTDNVNYYLSRIPCDPDNTTLGTLCEFIKYGGNDYIIPMEIFMVFMLLWVLNFIVALGHMTLAGAFGSYYWSWEKPKDIPAFPLARSLFRSIRYHLGSLAFGSLIIAIIQLIRIFLEYLDYKLKDSQNRVAKFILTVIVLDKVTDFLLFLSKILVTGAIFTMSFFWFKGSINFFDKYIVKPDLNYYLAPVIIQTVSTYLMTCVFFGVYNMAVDTLFLCFLEDIEMNDGSEQKPYFMSKDLMKILGKHNLSSATRGPHTATVTPDRKGRALPLPKNSSKA